RVDPPVDGAAIGAPDERDVVVLEDDHTAAQQSVSAVVIRDDVAALDRCLHVAPSPTASLGVARRPSRRRFVPRHASRGVRIIRDRGGLHKHRATPLAPGRSIFYRCRATDTRRTTMSVRLVVTITAAPGQGSELAQAYKGRCAEVMKEPGCEQFEVFQSVVNPDRLALLERWADQASLDVHAKLNATRPPLRPDLRVGSGEREDYTYNRTR